jgi:hypothetical protein
MKLCKDCKNILREDRQYSKCKIDPVISFVDGSVEYHFCVAMRESKSPDKCGPEAQFFAPMETEKDGAN